MRAEHLAGLVVRLARDEDVLPGEVAASDVASERIHAAVAAVRGAAGRWAALPVGEQWVVEWGTPAGRPARGEGRRGHR